MTSRTKPAIIPLANLPSDCLCLVSRAQVCSPAPSKVGLRWQGLDIVVQGPDLRKNTIEVCDANASHFFQCWWPQYSGASPAFIQLRFSLLRRFRHEGTNDNDRNDDDDDDGEVDDDD